MLRLVALRQMVSHGTAVWLRKLPDMVDEKLLYQTYDYLCNFWSIFDGERLGT